MKRIISEAAAIYKDSVELFKGKFFLYSAFYTLWTLFVLYNNNFFHPAPFWMFFSYNAFAAVPLLFAMMMEEKRTLLRVLLLMADAASAALLFFSSPVGPLRKFFSEPTHAYPAIIISILIIAVYLIYKKSFVLQDYGFSFGDVRTSVTLTLLSLLVMIPIVIIASRNPSFHRVYPLFKVMKQGGWTFIVYEIYFLIFFFMWEFFFRGVMLFSLKKHSPGSVYSAVMMQAVIFAFAHLGKPGLETFSSLFGGIILGVIILRIRTFLPAAIIHFAIALTMDIIAVFF